MFGIQKDVTDNFKYNYLKKSTIYTSIKKKQKL
ncbi:hypothetical protein IWQ47_003406 [Aquimarina sp. EL_43]|nr:hypothetical protein [Aquimarina sp. EL_35]MBG6149416.1 hypothetical protein [Aquimarina sp. EL_32]MBG6170321.1 hypothetical protein [Aquimarina sp. EL_43]